MTNPQSIGGVEKLLETLSVHSQPWARDAHSVIEHQLSVIGRMQGALKYIVSECENEASGATEDVYVDNILADMKAVAVKALSHSIIGDKS